MNPNPKSIQIHQEFMNFTMHPWKLKGGTWKSPESKNIYIYIFEASNFVANISSAYNFPGGRIHHNTPRYVPTYSALIALAPRPE